MHWSGRCQRRFIALNCSECNSNYEKEFNEDVAKRFENKAFCDKDINKFCLIIRKRLYIYEYIEICQRYNETSMPDKKEFYTNLNMEDITNPD